MDEDYWLYYSGARAGHLNIYYLGLHRHPLVCNYNDFVSLAGEGWH